MYDRMAKDADEEGFHELTEQFRGIVAIPKLMWKKELITGYPDLSTAHHRPASPRLILRLFELYIITVKASG